ncbi:metal ABC transporter ATP-binding protein [Helicobacter mustelae]|uniref:Putative ABC transporter ATP-binding protein n=1 Tax=Helicobacter mustelae (strain ATCC 43772 / CCUG 25715 / CIP 103759 / LMG 18044 / NCTC 12198 / R85-136P) TaxID=679897 RepID=D3UHK5_HELM1|nr:ABC transporter ATP-binding protein [Helicobacter mustelae]CBG39977.1 putative ABC transporter ATP-binding protein [Helicobacter mustelae 12198]SQH71491.1 ABC transporter ATP-binding protein [Helicobacter mustelae]
MSRGENRSRAGDEIGSGDNTKVSSTTDVSSARDGTKVSGEGQASVASVKEIFTGHEKNLASQKNTLERAKSPHQNPSAITGEQKEAVITCRDLYFAYTRDYVLKNVNFQVHKNDFLAVIGPNGGGKTTLIKLLLGLLQPSSGEIIFQEGMREKIGYVPQDTSINTDFPIQVMDVVRMGFLRPSLFGFRTQKKDDREAMKILERLGIAHLSTKKIGELSGGQRQRVLIARALCGNPKIIVLDEPTSNIDSKTQKEIYHLLKQLSEFHTIIVISHDISVLLGFASKVLSVNKEVISHDMPKLELSIDGHICEIDILNKMLERE